MSWPIGIGGGIGAAGEEGGEGGRQMTTPRSWSETLERNALASLAVGSLMLVRLPVLLGRYGYLVRQRLDYDTNKRLSGEVVACLVSTRSRMDWDAAYCEVDERVGTLQSVTAFWSIDASKAAIEVIVEAGSRPGSGHDG